MLIAMKNFGGSMNQASPPKINRIIWLIASLILLAIIGSYLWLQKPWNTDLMGTFHSANGAYQTTAASIGSLTASVQATGTIRAAQSAVLVWNSSGRVESASAVIGDKVSANQTLAALALDSVPSNIRLSEANLLTAQKNLDDLLLSNSGQAQAMQNLANAKQAVMDAQIKLDFYNWTSEGRAPGELIKDFQDKIKAAQLRLKFLEWVRHLRYNRTGDDLRRKADFNLTVLSSKFNLADLISNYNWFTGRPSDLLMDQTRAELNLAIAKEEDAQRDVNRYTGGKNPADVDSARAQLAAAQATLNLAKIIAPFDGTVTAAKPQTGDMVSAGQTAFRVDDLSHLLVDLQISEVDINNIAAGQPVTITLDAIPNKTYQGLVSKVNLSAKAGQGGVNYKVSITLTDADELVKPGMTAVVTIAVNQVTNTLMVPNSAVRMLNGQRIVYVLKENQAVPVNIRLGASANDNSQVVGGNLKTGDLIILNPPANTPVPGLTPTSAP